jgi:hypothetical protein
MRSRACRRLRNAVAIGAALAAVLAAPPAASAHLRTGTVAVDDRARVVSLSPLFTAGIYLSDRALHLTAHPGHTVVVLGYLGEPFVRVNEAGVWIDDASATARATGLVPKGSPAGWRLERGRRTVVWHDSRVQALPSGVRHASWTIPIVVDGRRRTISGTVVRFAAPALWPWLLVAVLVALAGGATGRGRERAVALVLGSAASACALVAASGFALGAYASPGTWIATVDEAFFALAGLAVLAWGPRGAHAAVGGGLGVLGLAVGLSRGQIFLHPIVLSALPGTPARALVAVAIGAGLAAAVAGAVFYARLEEPLSRALTAAN